MAENWLGAVPGIRKLFLADFLALLRLFEPDWAGTESDGFWHLQVEPKADALLILATILAAVGVAKGVRDTNISLSL